MKQCLKGRKVFLILLAIIFIGLFLRGIFFIKYAHNFTIMGDAKNYIQMSHQLVDKGIYGYWFEGVKNGGKPGISNARVSPGYPLFLSAVYAVSHDPYRQITIVRLLQVIIGGFLTPLLAFLFIKRAFKRNDVALLSAFFIAIYPTYINSSTQILTEVLSLATMLLYFYFTTYGIQERKMFINILAGAAFALHIHIRPAMLPLFLIPFLFALIRWSKNERLALLKILLQTLAGFVIVMLPWWIRNYVVLHQLIVTAAGEGNPLLAGSYPYLRSGMSGFMSDVPESIKGNSALQAEFAKERIIKGFTTEPMLYFKWYTIGKLPYLLKSPWLYNMSIPLYPIQLVIHCFFVGVGCIGVLINSVINRTQRFINIYGLAFLGIYLVFDPTPRYAYQHMFFLILAAAFILCMIAEKFKGYILRMKSSNNF